MQHPRKGRRRERDRNPPSSRLPLHFGRLALPPRRLCDGPSFRRLFFVVFSCWALKKKVSRRCERTGIPRDSSFLGGSRLFFA